MPGTHIISTLSKIFLMPMLFQSRYLCLYDSHFKGAFFRMEGQPDKAIYTLYKPDNSARFRDFVLSVRQMPEFIQEFELDANYIMIKFSVPDEFRLAYKLITEKSAYSKLPEEFKERVLLFTGRPKDELYHVLYRTQSLEIHREKEYNLPIGSLKGVPELGPLFNESGAEEFKLSILNEPVKPIRNMA